VTGKGRERRGRKNIFFSTIAAELIDYIHTSWKRKACRIVFPYLTGEGEKKEPRPGRERVSFPSRRAGRRREPLRVVHREKRKRERGEETKKKTRSSRGKKQMGSHPLAS